MKSFKQLHLSEEGGDGTGKYLVHKNDLVDVLDIIRKLPKGVDTFKDFSGDYLRLKALLKTSLRTKRENMPVIKQENIQDFVNFLNLRGIKASIKKISANQLKPIQKEIHFDKIVNNIAKHGEVTGSSKLLTTTIIASKKKFIIDGHHRWATVFMTDPKIKMKVLHVNIDIKRLLREAKIFADTAGNESRK